MAYYQLENGTLQTAAQLKRSFMGKIPPPATRRMLGIRTLTKAQYEKAKVAHLPAKHYRKGKGGKKVWLNPGNLPAFKVTTSSGYSYVTSMAKGITLQKAKNYFLGQYVDIGIYPEEKMEKVVKVTKVRSKKNPSKTGRYADPNAETIKMKPYKPAKPKPGSTSTTRRMKSVKNPTVSQAEASKYVDLLYEIEDKSQKEGTKINTFAIMNFDWPYSMAGIAFGPVNEWTDEMKEGWPELKNKIIQTAKKLKISIARSTTQRMKSVKNPHSKSMFHENKPDWLIYAKAPGMPRFEPLDLSEGCTVKNLMYASRFPYSQEAKVDSIIAKLRKQAPHIKVEKRSASGTRRNPRRRKNPPQFPSTVVPAYGRDYQTKAKAVAGWESGKDWIIADMSSPWDGKPISIRDFPPGSSVNLRYANLRKVTRYTHGSGGGRLKNPGKKKSKGDPSDWPDSKFPSTCFHFIPESKKLVMIQRGSGGYQELLPTLFMQWPKKKGESHQAYAKRMNKEMFEVSPAVAEEMAARSMFKWG